MNSNIENPSACLYIGNISSLDDQRLIKYFSRFGAILSCTVGSCSEEKRFFCDFRLLEFVHESAVEICLCQSSHRLSNIPLDVKSYRNVLDNVDLLNLDRKLFIGPIVNPKDIQTIVQFYRVIDTNLRYSLSRQFDQTHIIIEFTNRQYIRTILQQQTIPKTIDNQIFQIHPAIHPKECLKKIISSAHRQRQIFVQGLNEKITEKMLIDYFDKRAPLVAWQIFPNDRQSAIFEFDNENCVDKLLEISSIRLAGTNLSLGKASKCSLPILSTSNEDSPPYNNEQIDQLLETTGLTSVPYEKIVNPIQVRSDSSFNLPSPPPSINQHGWTSPPRTITKHCLSAEEHFPSITTEVKSQRTISQFVEQFQNDLQKVRDEYKTKFTEDRRTMEREINQLINNERNTLEKFRRYFYDHRQHSTEKTTSKEN